MTSACSYNSSGVLQGSILGPLLFLICLNDMLMSCDHLDVSLFADDTNLNAMSKFDVQVETDLKRLNQWLNSNKLVLNINERIQLNIKTSASLSRFHFNSSNVKVEAVCKSLGVLAGWYKVNFLVTNCTLKNQIRRTMWDCNKTAALWSNHAIFARL